MNNIKAFIIGSSGIVSLMFYIIYFTFLLQYKSDKSNSANQYLNYIVAVPIYFGIMNILFVNLNNNLRSILTISFVSSLLVFIYAYVYQIYVFNGFDLIYYYMLLLAIHIVAYIILSVTNNYMTINH